MKSPARMVPLSFPETPFVSAAESCLFEAGFEQEPANETASSSEV